MVWLVLGTAFFVGIHLFVSGTTLRDRLTDVMGERGYLVLFSLASLFGIVWMTSAYADSPHIELWGEPPGIGALATWITMPLAFLFAVIGITTPSPTSMGQEALLDGDAAKGILRITRHPFLWGVVIWAATHLLANGDAASLAMFSGMLVLALAGPHAIDGKRARKLGDKWEGFAAVTSNVPFLAIAQGRNHLALGEIAIWRWIAAVGLFVVVWYNHDAIFG
jgi:uncharacterized membrane protein